MDDKVLSEEDIELLVRQGLVADIRNQLNGPVNLLSLLRESRKDTEAGGFAKEYLEKRLDEMIDSSEISIAHILGAMTYSQRLPWYKRIRILGGKRPR